ncbi:hypothetical protein LCGC14_1308600 [marine sediment metagenome]|uniref:Uncharacterized protein n=1 Tax=marine sediment metagenome TaxID=412755 RepID=A0A0F9L7W7_9ZZZZ
MLRVTRQNIEVLISGDTPSARVARAHIQVLCKPVFDREASNTITIISSAYTLDPAVSNTLIVTNTAVANVGWAESASNALLIIQSTDVQGPLDVSATNVIAITQTAVPYETEQSASSTLTITQTAVAEILDLGKSASNLLIIQQFADTTIFERSPYNVLVITQVAVGEVTSKHASPVNVITITQEAKSHLHTRAVTNDITITQTAVGTNSAVHVVASNTLTLTTEASFAAINRYEVISRLITFTFVVDSETGEVTVIETGLSNTASVERSITNRGLSNDIEITQSVVFELDRVGYFERSVESILTITSTVDRDHTVESILTIISTAEFELVTQPQSALTITQTAEREVTLNRMANSMFGVAQTVTYEVVGRFDHCTYSPFIGSSTHPDAPTAPAIIPPTISRAGAVILERGADVLTLRLPELGNRDRLDFTRINRESRGGVLYIFSDPLWPKTENMQLDFLGCTEVEMQNILTFIKNTLGHEIIIHDWESRSWYGFITNPDTPVVRDNKGTSSIALELDVISDTAFLNGGANVLSIGHAAVAEVV